MGRKKDVERAALVEKLGLSTTKHYSKAELLEIQAKHEAKQQKDEERKAAVDLVAGPPPSLPAAELQIPYDLRTVEDPFHGLTERQKHIARLRMRGLSQQAIANLVGVAQPIISKELARIKEWQAEQGANVDQTAEVGSIRSQYSEVTEQAWKMFVYAQNRAMNLESPDPNAFADQVKALALVKSSTEAHAKFLMDMGLLKKASQEIKHVIEPSPFIQSWKDGSAKKKLADTLVSSQLPALPEPTPDDVIDGEVQEQEVDIVVPVKSDLAEPTPDEEDDAIELDTTP